MKYILSLSCGKDSVATLLYLLADLKKKEKDRRYPLDEVIQCEMQGWEFDSIETVSKQCYELCKANNIKFTKMVIPIMDKFNNYSWCGGTCRYGTTAKMQAMSKYYKEQYPNQVIVEYLGYADKEQKRINRYFNKVIKIYPLLENGITENDALVLCFKNHIHWWEENKNGQIVELYDYLDRVSCVCCRNKNLKELESIFIDFPKYWKKLKEMQKETTIQFRKNYSLEELEFRFSNKTVKLKESTLV